MVITGCESHHARQGKKHKRNLQRPDEVVWLGDQGRYAKQGPMHQEVDAVVRKMQDRGKRPEIIFFIVPRRGTLPPPPVQTDDDFGDMPRCTNVALRHGIL